MFDFSKTKSSLDMTKQDILDNQQMIFEYYFGQAIEPKKRYPNPLRTDNNPGCYFKWRNGLKFYDHAKEKVYDVFSYVEELYNCDFTGALRQIQQDFNDGLVYKKQINKPLVRFGTDEKHKIQFAPKAFTHLDLKWWGDYLITEEELKLENIHSVGKLYIDGKSVHIPEMCYAYYYPEIDSVKIYKPLERKEYKWYSNVPFNYIDGLKELPRASQTVLLAKAKKCKIVLKKVFSDVCATQGENYHAIPEWADSFFDEHYERKVCFFDSDATGQAANKKLNERGYGWVNIENYLLDCCKVKDPSDYVKQFKEYSYIINLLKNKGIL